MDDRPTYRHYARVERERRFLVPALPASVDTRVFERLEDLFVEATHLRLRRVSRADGTFVTYKLGQKILAPEDPHDPRLRQMTTIYLPEDEGRALAARLPGLTATKRRYKLREQGLTFCIDAWELPTSSAGLLLAEVEADSNAALERVTLPAWASREVTDDPAFASIAIARGAVPRT